RRSLGENAIRRMQSMRTHLTHVKAYRDRHGRTRYYFRRKGVPATALPGKPGSPEFVLAWQQAAAKAPAPVNRRSLPGSINAVVEAYYQDEGFKALADGTRAAHRRVLEHVRTWAHPTLGEYGKVLLRDIEKGPRSGDAGRLEALRPQQLAEDIARLFQIRG